jgi:hypothetical protein
VILSWLAACSWDEVAAGAAAHAPWETLDRTVDRSPFSGTVEERLDAGGYAYLRVDGRWVVGLDHEEQVGDPVVVRPLGLARDFVSARTGRTFDAVWFAVVARPE